MNWTNQISVGLGILLADTIIVGFIVYLLLLSQDVIAVIVAIVCNIIWCAVACWAVGIMAGVSHNPLQEEK